MITEKTCTKCKKVKPLTEFSKDKSRKHQRSVHCRSCVNAYYIKNKNSIIKRRKLRYNQNRDSILSKQRIYYEDNKTIILLKDRKKKRSLEGKVRGMYNDQVLRSKRKCHPPPDYTLKWLTNWLFTKTSYKVLHAAWVTADYETSIAPSVDRIDSDKPYTKDNIQLLTWKENDLKGRLEHMKPIMASPVDGTGSVLLFGSSSQAGCFVKQEGLSNGVNPKSSITSCCKGHQHTAFGYKWRYFNNLK